MVVERQIKQKVESSGFSELNKVTEFLGDNEVIYPRIVTSNNKVFLHRTRLFFDTTETTFGRIVGLKNKHVQTNSNLN